MFDMDRIEVDHQVRELLYDEKDKSIAFDEDKALLMQLPGTLPFAEITPHSQSAFEDMIEMLSSDTLGKSAIP